MPRAVKGKPLILIAKSASSPPCFRLLRKSHRLLTRSFSRLGVNEGKEDRVEELLLAITKSANSDAEPGCLVYRFNRSADKRTIFMYEEYKDQDAIKVRGLLFRELSSVAEASSPFSITAVSLLTKRWSRSRIPRSSSLPSSSISCKRSSLGYDTDSVYLSML